MQVSENVKARIILADGALQLAAKASSLLAKAVQDGDISVGEAVEIVQGVSGAFLGRK